MEGGGSIYAATGKPSLGEAQVLWIHPCFYQQSAPPPRFVSNKLICSPEWILVESHFDLSLGSIS